MKIPFRCLNLRRKKNVEIGKKIIYGLKFVKFVKMLMIYPFLSKN